VARKLGLLTRKQMMQKQLPNWTKSSDYYPTDPVKCGFALFGLGVFEGF
jgi:hypothetical protein